MATPGVSVVAYIRLLLVCTLCEIACGWSQRSWCRRLVVCIQRSAGHHASSRVIFPWFVFAFLLYLFQLLFSFFFSRLGVDMFFFIHFVMFNLAYFCGSVLGAA